MDPNPAHRHAAEDIAGLTDRLRTLPQYLLPQHALSRLVHRATRCRTTWWKDLLIDLFSARYSVDLNEAETTNPRDFADFNAFFTRALRDGARPAADQPGALLMPVDGAVCRCGPIDIGDAIRAKGHAFDATALLGGSASRAAPFAGGLLANLYLSPRDYHRIHMPLAGRLVEQVHVPGRLFAVNPPAVRTIPGLFARNERLALIFDTALGPLAIVLVGALFVGSIETVWSGEVAPPHGHEVTVTRYAEASAPDLARGAELGRFNMGSTVIVLFPPNAVELAAELDPGRSVRLGQLLGQVLDG